MKFIGLFNRSRVFLNSSRCLNSSINTTLLIRSFSPAVVMTSVAFQRPYSNGSAAIRTALSLSPSLFSKTSAATTTTAIQRSFCFSSSQTFRIKDNNFCSNRHPHSTENLFLHQSVMYSSSSGRSTKGRLNDNSMNFQGNDVQGAKDALTKADCVCFDVDSTVIMEEGIDVLAEFLNRGAEVAALTKKAMEGGMKFQDALELRLNLLRPSKMQIENCIQLHPFQLTPGVDELVQTLHDYGIHVHLVSGGFRIMIEPIAKKLNIPTTNITANTILFDYSNFYEGFDKNEPTSADMGKARAVQDIIAKSNPPYKVVVMIGDGMTDSQAKPPATAFIGFGGVVAREPVKQVSDWFVTDMAELIQHIRNTRTLTSSPSNPSSSN